MATTYLNVKGTVKWVKLFEPDEYAGTKRWMINFYPHDGGEWEKITKSGVQLETKTDPDGKFIRFRRDCQKLIKDDLIVFCPPEITGAVEVHYTNAQGDKIRQYTKGDKITVNRVGDPVTIGNGSLVVANLSVYDTARGKGHRLESVKVLDLVDVPKSKEDDPEPEDMTNTSSKQDDEIPF